MRGALLFASLPRDYEVQFPVTGLPFSMNAVFWPVPLIVRWNIYLMYISGTPGVVLTMRTFRSLEYSNGKNDEFDSSMNWSSP